MNIWLVVEETTAGSHDDTPWNVRSAWFSRELAGAALNRAAVEAAARYGVPLEVYQGYAALLFPDGEIAQFRIDTVELLG
jgi:hypothetical protein